MVTHRYNNKGITLIELLVVIGIVGILAAIAIPSYNSYMVRARRADAKTILEQVRAAQEMWRAERGTYAVDGGGNTVGDYNWNFTVKTTTTFTAQAVPNTTRQAGDGTLTIDHFGTKLPAAKWSK
jgi:type IV pilus assembly protein PilE